MKRFLLIVGLCMAHSAAGETFPECTVPRPDEHDLPAMRAAIEQLKTRCLPRIQKLDLCIVRTRLLAENVSEFMAKFRKPGSAIPLLVTAVKDGRAAPAETDINIWRNFQALQDDYEESLAAIETFVLSSQPTSPSSTAEALRHQLEDLDRQQFVAIDLLRSLSNRESALLAFIETARADLEASWERMRPEALWLAGESCRDAGTAPVVLKLQNAFDAFLTDADMIYTHIREAKKARQNLIKYTYTAIRANLERNYRNTVLTDLGSLGGKIDTILQADRLSTRFELWFTGISLKPDRDRVVSVYQQFEESRRLYAADLLEARDFREQMQAVCDAFPEVGRPYIERMDTVIEHIQSNLNHVEEKGWDGYLRNQQAVTARVLSRPERYPAACLDLYTTFRDQAEKVSSLESYRPVEKLYMKAVIGCSKAGS